MLGFWGVNDQFNPASGAEKLMDALPRTPACMLVNRCGHWVKVEHRDMFNRSCIDFLQNG